MSTGRNYRVLTAEKRHLFTVKENLGQEMRANFMGGMLGQQGSAFGLGSATMGRSTFVWTVHDPAGTPRGRITFQISGYHAVSVLTDSAGVPVLQVDVNRGLVGGLTATAALPDGRPMFQTHGNLIRHNFSILDPSGRELAKIHEAWASVRDTYSLDLVANVDPLGPLDLRHPHRPREGSEVSLQRSTRGPAPRADGGPSLAQPGDLPILSAVRSDGAAP